MKSYQDFFLEEFYFDEAFRKWVLKPEPEDHARWEQWLSEHTEKETVVAQARELVHALQPAAQPLSAFEKKEAMDAIMRRFDEHTVVPLHQKPTFLMSRLRLAAAASVVFVALACLWFFRNPAERSLSYTQLVSASAVALREVQNTGTTAMLISLSDQSTVSLDPGSKLSYPDHFEDGSRTVYLSGSAFFQVNGNPLQPFYVYADDVVTKVLGTGFRVRSVQGERSALVSVKTGRVAVFTRETIEDDRKSGNADLAGVLIEPNQQVSVDKESAVTTKTLVEEPYPTDPGIIPTDFEDSPVSVIFKTLQKAYGIEITFDEELMKNCPVTASLAGLTFYEQLELVCDAVGAEYKVTGDHITITGGGCGTP
ncbi:FecR family protein [Dyadobacter sandarakinus]|uniref:FecR domain-containing protein n=1 Tax=Dyadobacter sandarakinus TaxID=2747268 RepID=A0ABX7I2G4_9BACT|nr:FecR family protein [Dyadobacter sandarakinus]QRR00272.1 FecR domain-containing protein [Dyadobacter sandarakinus]